MKTPVRWVPFFVAAFLAAGLSDAGAQSRSVVVYNNSKSTIYKLFAWPSDLVPRTYNIVNFPIKPNESSSVDLENLYGDCYFTFQGDFTAPLPKRRARTVRQPKIKPILRVLERVNLCDPKIQVIFR